MLCYEYTKTYVRIVAQNYNIRAYLHPPTAQTIPPRPSSHPPSSTHAIKNKNKTEHTFGSPMPRPASRKPPIHLPNSPYRSPHGVPPPAHAPTAITAATVSDIDNFLVDRNWLVGSPDSDCGSGSESDTSTYSEDEDEEAPTVEGDDHTEALGSICECGGCGDDTRRRGFSGSQSTNPSTPPPVVGWIQRNQNRVGGIYTKPGTPHSDVSLEDINEESGDDTDDVEDEARDRRQTRLPQADNVSVELLNRGDGARRRRRKKRSPSPSLLSSPSSPIPPSPSLQPSPSPPPQTVGSLDQYPHENTNPLHPKDYAELVKGYIDEVIKVHKRVYPEARKARDDLKKVYVGKEHRWLGRDVETGLLTVLFWSCFFCVLVVANLLVYLL
jgi:hypothetical protein